MAASGVVDAVIGRYVVGWVHDPREAGRRVELEVELDGEVVAQGVADIERADLRAAGIGDGHHAFRVELPEGLTPGAEHVLMVRTRPDQLLLPLANDFSVEHEEGVSGPPAVVYSRPRLSRLGGIDGAGAVDAVAPAPEIGKALLGADGWLFDLGDRERLNRLLGHTQVGLEEIRAWRARLLTARARLSENRIGYLVAAVPDKSNLYADQLPEALRPPRHGGAVELIGAALRDDNDIELFDLLAPLHDARHHGQLAPRTGEGLTWLGAFYAYRAIAKELAKRFPTLQPRSARAITLGVHAPVHATLAGRERVVLVGSAQVSVAIGAEEPETEPELAKHDLRATYAPLPHFLRDRLGRGCSLLECERPDVDAGLVVVHDGSGARIASLLAEHFASTVVIVRGKLPHDVIEQQGPALVVHLIDERSFCSA